ncbi:integration host factor, actinobacterial type [Corynebacterium sp. CNJ-954]|uniref:integration host factor, actinobacterial type n=1 Tax=Corynebacterium sp. CNJ-954 TaxID=1904962 RepID=UPI000ACE4974|nr:integration host factor, actinobacterial type [Corynebacterium sp. CNJ-954]
MASSLPTPTPQQRATALQKAAETRAKRAEFTARLRTGETSGSAGLDEALGDEVLAKTRLTSFLRALPGWGKVSIQDFLELLVSPRTGGWVGWVPASSTRCAGPWLDSRARKSSPPLRFSWRGGGHKLAVCA